MAQSIELPPPTATIRSMRSARAKSSAAATLRVVGFSSTPSKTKTSSPASRSDATARCGMAGRPQAGVGDEQHAFAAELARQFAQAVDGADAEHDRACPDGKSSAGRPGRGLAARTPRERGMRKLPAFDGSSGSGGYPGRSVGCPLRATQARSRREVHCTTTAVSGGKRAFKLERAGAEQEVHDAALVRLQPVELDRRDRPDVQPVDVRRRRAGRAGTSCPRVIAEQTSVGPIASSIFSCGHLTTVQKGNMYSFFAAGCSGESHSRTVGRR